MINNPTCCFPVIIYTKSILFPPNHQVSSRTSNTDTDFISLFFIVPRMLKNLTCLLQSSMRTLMRSTVLIFYENTALLCCISLTLASLNPRLPNSIFLRWIFHLSLSQGEISLTISPVLGICCFIHSLAEKTK